MGKIYITQSAKQTQKLGERLAGEILKGGKRLNLFGLLRLREVEPLIICMTGDLGSGKTTFTQGILKGLKVKGPYTSPTFLIMKHYRRKIRNPKSEIRNKFKIQNSRLPKPGTGGQAKFKIINIYHVDAYRIKSKDILDLGWEEIIGNDKNIVIIEWAERIKRIIPRRAVWIRFKWLDKNRRNIKFK